MTRKSCKASASCAWFETSGEAEEGLGVCTAFADINEGGDYHESLIGYYSGADLYWFHRLRCVQQPSGQADAGWITLLDGSNLDSWNRTGNANWRLADGLVQADKGNGHLVSKNIYTDFQLRAEFWVDADANSGIHFRCADPQKIGSATCYEVNIFDKRADPDYGTGAIVNVAKVSPMPKAGGRWNTFEITAKGPQLTVILNGIRTADVQDTKHARGPITIQYSAGVVKFRRLEIKPL